MDITKIILLLLIVVLSIILLRIIIIERFEETKEPVVYPVNIGTTAIVTTVRNPHKIEDWIEYHLKIGFNKLYIVLDDENENIEYKDDRVVIFKNPKNMFITRDERIMTDKYEAFETFVKLLKKKKYIKKYT